MYAEDPARDFVPEPGPRHRGDVAGRRARRHLGARPAPRSPRSTTRCSPRSWCTRRRAPTRSTRCTPRSTHDARRARHRDQRRAAPRRSSTAPRSPTATVTTDHARTPLATRRRAVDVLAPRQRPRCRTCPGASGYGTSACRRAARWTTARSGSATASSATPTARPASSAPRPGPTLRFAPRRDRSASPARDARGHARRRAGAVRGPPVAVPEGARLAFGARIGPGPAHATCSSAAASTAGTVLGSASTFTLGGFGGHGGRELRTGDVLHLGAEATRRDRRRARRSGRPRRSSRRSPPSGSSRWSTARTRAPDFVTEAGMAAFYATEWQVHHHSSRTGVRLVGPPVGVGPRRRRRGRAAPVERARHAVHRRRGRLHRRHADPARARRPEPRRLHVPGHGDQRRPLEARAARAGRHRAVRARRPRRGPRTRSRARTLATRTRTPRRTAARTGRPRPCSPPGRVRRRTAGHLPRAGRRARCSSSTGR